MDNDTISRQAALNELHLLAIEALRKQRHDYNALITICSNKLRDLPAIQPVQKTGRWIDDNCSECGQYVYHGDARNYCPNCGSYNGGKENGGH